MAAIDTNILVRFLVEDDAAQCALAQRLIAAALNAGDTLYVPITVALELEWVLRSNFGFSKSTVVQTLHALLSSTELSFESEPALELALMLFEDAQNTKADFSDCLHIALAHKAEQAPLWTFDKAAAKIEGARLLS